MLETAERCISVTIGVDLGDRVSHICELDEAGEVILRTSVGTTRAAFGAYFDRPRCRVVMEAGTHSPWISRQLEALGHEVVVANPTEVYGGRRRKRRNDPMDAEFLARQGRADVKLLYPIRHTRVEAQQHLETLKARDQLVGVRSKLIGHVRGAVKSLGSRIGKCSAEAFHHRAAAQIPQELRGALEPLLAVVEDLTQRIRAFDDAIERLATEHYPIALRLQQPKGVGPVTALAYVLRIDDPKRFKRSRDVGAYVGLAPRLDESSDSSPQLRITKAGDPLLRKLLVNAAHYIMGPFGPDCDLRRHGERIAARGGKNAKKRAVVAVARKLAVLLHRLWVSGEVYDPDWNLKQQVA
jgi:transposase